MVACFLRFFYARVFVFVKESPVLWRSFVTVSLDEMRINVIFEAFLTLFPTVSLISTATKLFHPVI